MKRTIATVLLTLVAITLTASGSIAAVKQKVVVDMFGSQLGSYGYTAMYAASEIINKHSPTIKANIYATFGAMDNIKRLDTDKDVRKHAFFMTSVPAMYGARAGVPKQMFPNPIIGAMNVFNSIDGTYTLITTNPNIKTPLDFVGKRVDVGPYGNFLGTIGDYLLDAYDVRTKVAKLEHNADQKVMYDNLKEGKIDVSSSGILKTGNKMGLAASTKELMAGTTIYPVGYSKEMIRKAAELSKIPFATWEVPAGEFSPKTPAFVTMYYPLNVVCHQEMPQDLVYEVMKVLIAHADEFKNYSQVANFFTKEVMAGMPLPVSDFHPGAVKAYREMKVKVGEEAFK